MIKKLEKYLKKYSDITISDLISIIKQKNYYDENNFDPFTLSEKALKDEISLRILTTNSWLYLYGYPNNCPIEKTLFIGRMINNDSADKVISSGFVTRFELVSDKDLFYYGGGSAGKFKPNSLQISESHLIEQSFLTIHFVIGEIKK